MKRMTIKLDWLQFGEKEPEGILAILYRALWAMAEVRERLKLYEDICFAVDGTELLAPWVLRIFREARLNTGPLTEEQLREMNGDPVYLDLGDGGEWVLVRLMENEVYFSHKNTICAPAKIALNVAGKCIFSNRRPPQMRSKPLLFALFLALLLAVTLRPPPHHMATPPPGPAVRIIPPPAELTAPEPVEAAEPPLEVHVIEECTVTWYTEDTCGKAPDHPAYGITASGLPVEEGVTCAVDPEVIPLGAEVQVLFSDGTIGTFRATDTEAKGEWVDIYTPSYDYAVQCGLQKLTVCWAAPKEEIVDA